MNFLSVPLSAFSGGAVQAVDCHRDHGGAEIDGGRRGETLTIEEFCALARVLDAIEEQT